MKIMKIYHLLRNLDFEQLLIKIDRQIYVELLEEIIQGVLVLIKK